MCQEVCVKENWMKDIANLLFEAAHLKRTPRSGFNFLGAGRESVAEHTFCALFIAWVMTRLETGVDALRLMSMCLVHDLPESRIGDINYVQKQYVRIAPEGDWRVGKEIALSGLRSILVGQRRWGRRSWDLAGLLQRCW